MAATGEQRVEWVALDDIARWPRNPKLHRHDLIAGSVGRFGFIQPPLVDEGTGQLVAGHGRLETLQQLRAAGKPPPPQVRVRPDGMWEMPVLRGLTFASPQEAEAYLLADNRLGEIGGWDEVMLTEMTTELVDVGVSLDGTGFTDVDMRALVEQREVATGAPPTGAKQPEYTAAAGKDVVYVECPACKHKFPR
jgi:hypothetical protein